jgi:O-antigen/teichoic acid export membrane protein
MLIEKITKRNFISRIFTDNSLTKKASLNAIASLLDYGAKLIVGFIIQPVMVAFLGDYFYGTWQILNRMIDYITPSSGKPAQALRWTLAHEQASSDYEKKRQSVASSVTVWAIFLPFLVVLGTVVTWFAPFWIKAPPEYFLRVRLTAMILVADLIMTSLGQVPLSVMQGENMGYKRMGLSVGLVFLGGGLTWLVLWLGWGVAGVAISTLAATIISGLFYLQIVRTFAPWFGWAKPTKALIKRFLGLTWWFLVWNLVMNFMMSSDVVVLGTLDSVESVTAYSLTKYAPEMLISIIAIVIFGIAPGLGGIIGSGDLKKANKVRGEIMSISWLVITILGASVLLWNRTFVGLWAGDKYFTGDFSALLIVIVVVQFVLIRNDSNIIDLTLNIRQKVLMGAISAGFSIGLAALFVSVFKLGIVGLSLGLFLGRAILSLGYPIIVGRYLGVTLASQLKSCLKPAFITVILFSLATLLDHYVIPGTWKGLTGWIQFILSAGTTALLFLGMAFYTGLSGDQRKAILRRFQAVVAINPD